jgi:membrane protein YqaA with SNARE-associated domain
MNSMSERNPKVVIYGTTIAVALLAVSLHHMFPFELLVIGLAIVAFVGCIVSTLPPAEYMVATAVSAVIAMVVPLVPWILVIPGLVTGYICGHMLVGYLEGRNIDRLRAQQKQSRKYRKIKKTTSF